ncbi:transcription-repair coupling factor [candidate division KSB1 bacterium]|nr:transcription-repair coupling factor [candidate division KSB1 bacterium]
MKNDINMFIREIKQKISTSGTLAHLLNQIGDLPANRYVKGISGSLLSLVMAHIFERTSHSIFYVCVDELQAEMVKQDLELLIDPDQVAFFPAKELFAHRKVTTDAGIQSQRMASIEKLINNKKTIVVASARCIARKVAPLSNFRKQRIELSHGKNISFDSFIQQLDDMGYRRQPLVEYQGDLSVRGGIIDIFPFSKDEPVRVEFFGDQIESIRTFDIATQRSVSPISALTIYPKEHDSAEGVIRDPLVSNSGNLADTCLVEYLPKNALLILEEPERIGAEIDSIRFEMEKLYHLGEHAIDLSSQRNAPYFDWKGLQAIMREYSKLNLIAFKLVGIDDYIDFNSHLAGEFSGNLKLLQSKIDEYSKSDSRLDGGDTPAYFLCEYPEQVQRMKNLFDEVEISPNILAVKHCGLSGGFVFPEAGLMLITHHQFYGRFRRMKSRKKAHAGLTRAQLEALSSGDYVVHEDHGIGKFVGLKKITVSGSERECIHIIYKEKDSLYVPLDRMNRVQKYSAKEGAVPVLNRLGGSEWQKLKKRTKRRIKDIARELIALYAARRASKGFAFSPDSHWLKELEASFVYDETPDQERAITEVKRDMESDQPMDRLVCGDVGFGKTEVAIRAAFKAINDNRQAAMLVPTTILAQQHYATFNERLASFPVKVEMLSRFRTKQEQAIIIKRLSEGKIDIIIGTHRILSNDIKFKNLGLLIVDEEQRFGVRHKEQIKHLKKNIDVLTLTATPIPRTLHMSLIGARDMSNIDTAPRNRLPVFTEVLEFDKEFIKEAILREVERGGQVFFVHNRVQTIDAVADMIRRLVPEVKVATGHGQMYEKRLEKIMLDFMHKKYHVLVATMIIENGLDIPNVNTIIIHRADRFGLAQLYQLRGRVGRSSQRAYAYLLIPPIRRITNIALKRLQTIEEFTELGAGFKIAMRDLEIRGAGSVLGAEQSGFIDALGFNLYCKILDEAVKELQIDEKIHTEAAKPPAIETIIDVDLNIHIPVEFISHNHIRLDFYRRLVDSIHLKQIDDIQEEMIDRFGKLPEAANNLFELLRMKLLGKMIGLSRVYIKEKKFIASFSPEIYAEQAPRFQEWISSLIERANLPFKFVQDSELLQIHLRLNTSTRNRLKYAKKFLQSLV